MTTLVSVNLSRNFGFKTKQICLPYMCPDGAYTGLFTHSSQHGSDIREVVDGKALFSGKIKKVWYLCQVWNVVDFHIQDNEDDMRPFAVTLSRWFGYDTEVVFGHLGLRTETDNRPTFQSRWRKRDLTIRDLGVGDTVIYNGLLWRVAGKEALQTNRDKNAF